ncbi:hypothetical protein [Paenibacillus sp. FSL K6-1318]|uniref:hypothetical protein n=1 Tax=Paenibacillus sp. FSL K6-1318 TaxID=2975291 RepID=UPI0030EE8433
MSNSENKNISYEQHNNKFNFRVAGIVIDKGRVLLHTTGADGSLSYVFEKGTD